LKDILLDATLAKAMTDCCVANTIVTCYYWSFEVANVVAKGRVREKDKENVVKGHEVISGQTRIWSKIGRWQRCD
jgi:hypothetical protein